MGAPISQGGPQNVKILGPQGPKIFKLWGLGGPKMGGSYSHMTTVVVENKSIDPEAPEDNGIVDCSCGAREDDHGNMVKCECCGCWSHSSCAGLCVSSAESLSIFLCYKCIVHTDQPASE